jgi:23S rRNA pseudouridine1911/1915/1917 synthase
MPDARLFHIRDSLDGSSLAQAMRQLFPGKSWAETKKLIANRHVQVHGNLCVDEGRRLRTGDVVKVFVEPLAKPPDADAIQVVYRDEHLVIIEKPAGLTTLRHAGEREMSDRRKQNQPTLDELLNRVLHRPAEKKSTFRDKRPHRGSSVRTQVRPVHRLDRDTSGLMVFALSSVAEQKLVELFKEHEINRTYRAVVHGRLNAPTTIESMFVRDRGDGLRGSSAGPNAADAQRAVTHVKPVEHVGDYTIVECRLETGRTHQIRIHLAEAGHRLCGERMYTHPLGQRAVRDDSGAPRQALHSFEIAFAHPITGKMLQYTSRWPVELAQWLKRVRAGSPKQ